MEIDLRERVQKIDEWLRLHKSHKVTGHKRPNCSFYPLFKVKKDAEVVQALDAHKSSAHTRKLDLQNMGKIFLEFIAFFYTICKIRLQR